MVMYALNAINVALHACCSQTPVLWHPTCRGVQVSRLALRQEDQSHLRHLTGHPRGPSRTAESFRKALHLASPPPTREGLGRRPRSDGGSPSPASGLNERLERNAFKTCLVVLVEVAFHLPTSSTFAFSSPIKVYDYRAA